jgi:NADPH-dependent 2,4-dienoyl-CoA reductase/sulfur reductase-like enzyme
MKIQSNYDVVVIGSGPGGTAAAISARKAGCSVLMIERDVEPGGILLQCIHNGFGLETIGEDLPGPFYAQRYLDEAFGLGVHTLLDTMVLEISPERRILAANRTQGIIEINAKSIVLSMGCRERTRSQVRLPGARPAGVFTAGAAQRWVNVEGFMPGKRFVILGSGDIGMIMARRLTLEGAKVERVLEVMPYLNGLMRNYVQCLMDFDIPLQLQHTVRRVIGSSRVEAIESVQVDDKWAPVPGTEEIIPCDTLLLSVGLIPENELSRKLGVKIDPVTGGPYVTDEFQTNLPGIFAAGNVVHVYDLVDWVTEAGFTAGKGAARFALAGKPAETRPIPVKAGQNVRYVVPHTLSAENLTQGDFRLQFRVTRPLEKPVLIEVMSGEERIAHKSAQYARPGEMVTVTLTPRMYDRVRDATELSVSVTER